MPPPPHCQQEVLKVQKAETEEKEKEKEKKRLRVGQEFLYICIFERLRAWVKELEGRMFD